MNDSFDFRRRVVVGRAPEEFGHGVMRSGVDGIGIARGLEIAPGVARGAGHRSGDSVDHLAGLSKKTDGALRAEN
jgi:hypothetical protein